MAFLQAVGGFMQQAVPMVQNAPELAPMALEMLKFGVTAFKAGKQLEGIIDQTADELRNQAEQAKGKPKPPSAEQMKMQAQMQLEQAKMQAEQQKLQIESQLEQQKMQMQMQLEKAKQEYQAQENQLKFQLEDQRNEKEAQMEMQIAKMKQDSENNKAILIAYLDNANKLETARIGAGLDDGTAAYIENVEQAKILQDSMGYSQMADHPLKPALDQMHQSNQQLTEMLAALITKMHQPKRVVRDENGKIVEVH
jgi:hypothetical protein